MHEFELIDAITRDLPMSDAVRLGPGDDAAVLEPGVAVSTDVLVEHVHFRTDWCDAHHVGRKVVAANVADIEAMGAVPTGIVIALAVPAERNPDWVTAFADGVREECDLAGISLVGGDMSSAQLIVATGTSLGQFELPPVTRAGARPGDVVAVCGRLGWAAAGLKTLQRGFRSPIQAVEAYRVPRVPYGQGIVAARAGATAMIDISDGLVADAGHIAERSGVGIDLHSDALEIPDIVRRVAIATGTSELGLLLTGGEDHALLACFPPDAVPAEWCVIGAVTDGDGQVTVDGEMPDGETGWKHF